jgi:hypothetical protein
MKENIKKFISAVMNQQYKKADTLLKSAVNEKIKQKIINNNRNIF